MCHSVRGKAESVADSKQANFPDRMQVLSEFANTLFASLVKGFAFCLLTIEKKHNNNKGITGRKEGWKEGSAVLK